MTKKSVRIISKLEMLALVPFIMVIVLLLSCKKTEQNGPLGKGNNELSDIWKFQTDERMPEFPGGSSAMVDFISKNIRYPETARKAGRQGRVLVSFTVNRKGKVKNTTIKKGVCPDLDAEALRVVKMMPDWNPGKMDDVYLTLPIHFKLADYSLVQSRIDC